MPLPSKLTTLPVSSHTIAKAAKDAHDAVFKGGAGQAPNAPVPGFPQTEAEALLVMQQAVQDGTWRSKCKARDVIKAYCGIHKFKYEHFRNCIIAKLAEPPAALAAIMGEILK